jgi:putative transcriptional regulator
MRLKNSVAEYRKKTGLTQEELAKRVGVSRQTIISIEKGNYVPSLLLGFQLAETLQVSLETLFSLEL